MDAENDMSINTMRDNNAFMSSNNCGTLSFDFPNVTELCWLELTEEGLREALALTPINGVNARLAFLRVELVGCSELGGSLLKH